MGAGDGQGALRALLPHAVLDSAAHANKVEQARRLLAELHEDGVALAAKETAANEMQEQEFPTRCQQPPSRQGEVKGGGSSMCRRY